MAETFIGFSPNQDVLDVPKGNQKFDLIVFSSQHLKSKKLNKVKFLKNSHTVCNFRNQREKVTDLTFLKHVLVD